MRQYLFLLLVLIGSGKTTLVLANEALYAPEISPKDAWDFLNASSYQDLPHYKVTYRSFFSRFGENLLLRDSQRTVKHENHFIPPQRKLIFPNGICVRGEWTIDEHPYNYSGYFKSGSKGVIIGRVAVSLSNLKYKQLRTLAISGKVFPTTNLEDPQALKAANFLLMNDNAGKKRTYLTEAALTNAAPRTVSFAALPLLRIALAVAKTFDLTDTRRDVRQLYQIAELDDVPPYTSPKWIRLMSSRSFQRMSHKIGAQDFREEVMKLIDLNKSLEFEIFVADDLLKGQPQYHKIGRVAFKEYVASQACDESLHFQHPPYREEYALPVVDQKLP